MFVLLCVLFFLTTFGWLCDGAFEYDARQHFYVAGFCVVWFITLEKIYFHFNKFPFSPPISFPTLTLLHSSFCFTPTCSLTSTAYLFAVVNFDASTYWVHFCFTASLQLMSDDLPFSRCQLQCVTGYQLVTFTPAVKKRVLTECSSVCCLVVACLSRRASIGEHDNFERRHIYFGRGLISVYFVY